MSVYYNFETSEMGSFTIFDIKEKGIDISFTESIKITGYMVFPIACFCIL